MIRLYASDRRIREFTDKLLATAKRARREAPERKSDLKIPPPSHEISWSPVSNLPANDPYGFLRILSITATEQRDLETFERALDRAFEVVSWLYGSIGQGRLTAKDLSGTDVVLTHGASLLVRIGLATRGAQERQVFAERFLNKLSVFVIETGLPNYSVAELLPHLLTVMESVAEDLLQNQNRAGALIPVITIRQLATEAVESQSPEDRMQAMLIMHAVEQCARSLQRLGEMSIRLGHADYLYACFDALGWLGCAAAREDESGVGNACANALAQLGRIARAKKLACFYTRCALLPEDHAYERIQWIITWTAALEGARREGWGESMAEAISRLLGRQTSIHYEAKGEKFMCRVDVTEHPYKFTMNDNGRVRTIDYSDPDELKDFHLY